VVYAVAIAVAVGIGYVIGYEQYASRPAKVIAGSSANSARSCPAAPPAAPGEVRVNGVVENPSDTGFTVHESTKGRARVAVTLGSAAICRTVAGTVGDIQAGEHVVVRGSQSAGGVDAAAVTISRGAPGS
jgi:hypothetical protein